MLDCWIAQLAARRCFRCETSSWSALCGTCEDAAPCEFKSPRDRVVRALGLYEQAPGAWVRRLKYQEESVWAAGLGRALAHYLPQEWRAAQLIPVPLHPERLVERGFNQSALIARSLAQKRKLSLDCALLYRTRETAAQARLGKKERGENLKNAFACRASTHPRQLIIVDDVVTTGHTFDACADALEAEGHQVLGGLACAIARTRAHLIT